MHVMSMWQQSHGLFAIAKLLVGIIWFMVIFAEIPKITATFFQTDCDKWHCPLLYFWSCYIVSMCLDLNLWHFDLKNCFESHMTWTTFASIVDFLDTSRFHCSVSSRYGMDIQTRMYSNVTSEGGLHNNNTEMISCYMLLFYTMNCMFVSWICKF